MKLIAIDNGFGYMKATDGKKEISYINIACQGRPTTFDFSTNSDPLANLHVKISGDRKASGEFFLGELAKDEVSDANFITSTDRVNSEKARASLLTAVAMLAENDPGESIALTTGLPWDHYGGLKDKYMEGLTGDFSVTFVLDSKTEKTVDFSVTRAYTYPQGVGVYFDQIIDSKGEFIANQPLLDTGTFGVIDVGTRTTDIELFEHLRLNQNFCAGKDIGINQVKTAVASALAAQRAPNQDGWVEEIIQRTTARARRTVDNRNLGPVIQDALVALGKEISDIANGLWEAKGDMLETVFVAGGGGTMVFDHIRLDAPNAKLILVERPMFANVYGFYKAVKRALNFEAAEGMSESE